MQIIITVNLDDQQLMIAGNKKTHETVDGIATALEMATAGAMHQFRDGNPRHGCVLDYEINTELHY